MVNFSEIEDAFHFVSAGSYGMHTAVLSLDSGRIYWRSELADLDELAEGEPEGAKFVEIPHKNELGLGQDLVFEFVERHLPEQLDLVRQFFLSRGAYSRFKSLLESKNLLQDWYAFEARREEEALREWCEGNEIPISG